MIGSVKAMAEWILSKDDIAIITHIRPDGDAFGSALALMHAFQDLGKRAFVACDDPAEKKYLFLPGIDGVCTKDNMPFSPKAVLTSDVSDQARTGKLEAVFLGVSEDNRAVLDHHHTNPGFAKICYIDGDSASTGEMALELIEELGVSVSHDIALCLFTAISTDCGNFSFGNTTARSYIACARCVEAGVDVEDVTRKLYRTRSFEKTRLIGMALESIHLSCDGQVASISISNEMFERAGATHADTHSIVNYLNEIEGVRIGFVAEEMENGKDVKFSFRAAYGADVAALAREFGGGGHIAASGATVKDTTLEKIVPTVEEAAARHVREMA